MSEKSLDLDPRIVHQGDADRVWTTYGTVLAVSVEKADVMGAAVTLSGDYQEGGFSVALTVAEALLLAEMLTANVRSVIREVGL